MNLLESPKVKKDLKNYKIAVDKITDVINKQYYQNLFNEYTALVKIINETHSSNPGLIRVSSIQEHIKGLGDLRLKLDKLVKDTN